MTELPAASCDAPAAATGYELTILGECTGNGPTHLPVEPPVLAHLQWSETNVVTGYTHVIVPSSYVLAAAVTPEGPVLPGTLYNPYPGQWMVHFVQLTRPNPPLGTCSATYRYLMVEVDFEY